MWASALWLIHAFFDLVHLMHAIITSLSFLFHCIHQSGVLLVPAVLPLSGPLKSLLALRDAVDPSATVTAFSKP